jgi:hypothetical protein
MTLKQRTMVLGSLVLMGTVIYAVALHYSPILVSFVVRQTLVRRAPSGVTAQEVEKRLDTHLQSFPDSQARLERLFNISQYLEKVQKLDSRELDELLSDGRSTSRQGVQ